MGNTIVKITGPKERSFYQQSEEDFIDEFGEDYLKYWHLVDPTDAERLFCDGLAYEDETEHKSKTVNRGGITCPNCLSKLNAYKNVKL